LKKESFEHGKGASSGDGGSGRVFIEGHAGGRIISILESFGGSILTLGGKKITCRTEERNFLKGLKGVTGYRRSISGVKGKAGKVPLGK